MIALNYDDKLLGLSLVSNLPMCDAQRVFAGALGLRSICTVKQMLEKLFNHSILIRHGTTAMIVERRETTYWLQDSIRDISIDDDFINVKAILGNHHSLQSLINCVQILKERAQSFS